MLDLLFDPPWWLPACLALLGIVLFYQGNRTQNRGQRNAGLAVVVGVILLMLMAYYIETPVEQVTSNSRELAKSAGSGDWNTFEALLDPQVSFDTYRNKPALMLGAKLSAASIGLKSVSVTGIEIKRNGDLITAYMRCLSVQDRTLDQPYPTDWQLDWRDSSEGWKLYHVEPMQNATVGPEQIQSHLIRP